MQSHSCRKCGTLVLKRNKSCTRCGAPIASARPLPVFWFLFTAWTFVGYVALDILHLV